MRLIDLDSSRYGTYTWSESRLCCGSRGPAARRTLSRENRAVTKKEIVRTISEELGLTQLKTKEIVQRTFDAIVETLVEETQRKLEKGNGGTLGRIELRNFGVFEVKKRAPRKARKAMMSRARNVAAKPSPEQIQSAHATVEAPRASRLARGTSTCEPAPDDKSSG